MSASPETTTAPTAATEVPKIFVGNLSFKTTDGQLKDFFSDVGEVTEARIVTRGPRSMGYGFVSYGDIDTVNKAVAAKNQAELDGRPLNVEVARVPTKEEAAERAAKPARRRQPRRKAAAADGEAKTDSDVVEAAQPAVASENSGEDSKATKSGAGRRNNGRRTRRFPKKEKTPADGSAAPAPAPASAAPKADATPSETVTFIGNLPFSTTDEELSKLFAEFSITSAHVVIAKKNQRPKGFGFVTFANNEEQTRAIKQFGEQPLVVAERVLSIKPALSESPAADQASEGEAAAAAAGSA
ncbi:hypothetical protein LPJ53_001270 [Coemansia erecta]|uniref:RRM domain-containing protein n=1 Tax=Coemansia erecta TaxID=147472 RepID=A0A9W7Y6V8_9FUNG|nr:hypothetical protein LPJ53_001270 [Coemansia erecta]